MDRLILCGGGHVSCALAQVAAVLDFQVVVLDDRAEFVTAERFPAAWRLVRPFHQGLVEIGHTPRDFFAILTRGHAFDLTCLAQILEGPFAYVGMIGSRGKVSGVMEQLERQGVSPALLHQVHAPIGLAIGGQTPGEIAVAIGAELVQVRAALGALPPPPPETPGVLVTITAKSGSAPRGVGAWMLVAPDGNCVGTIGGGAVEFAARQDALALWAHQGGPERKRYDLSAHAADLGMVCGGSIEVLLERRNLDGNFDV